MALATTKSPALDALIARAQEQQHIVQAGLGCTCASLANCAATIARATPGAS